MLQVRVLPGPPFHQAMKFVVSIDIYSAKGAKARFLIDAAFHHLPDIDYAQGRVWLRGN